MHGKPPTRQGRVLNCIPVHFVLQKEADTSQPFSDHHRKCISQFSDADSYRREGRNTWLDESGVYANSHFQRQLYVAPNPITGDVCN